MDPLAPVLSLPGVADDVAAARTAVDVLLAHRVLRRRAGDVAAESSLRGAWASAVLAGSAAQLPDVRAGAAAGDPVVQGSLRAYAAIPTLAETWRHAPRQALARLHTLAAAGQVDEDRLGRPSARAEVAQRLDLLASVLADTRAPAVVVAGLVHAEVLALDAFPPVSGVLACAGARLVLIERGLDPRSLVLPEAAHLADRNGYADAITRYGTDADVAGWVRYFAGAVVAGARETTAICEAVKRG